MPIYKGSTNKGYASSLSKRIKQQQEDDKFAASMQSSSNDNQDENKPGLLKRITTGAKNLAVDTAKSIGNDVKQAGVTVEKGLIEPTVEVGRASVARATGNKSAEQAALRRGNKALKEEAQGGIVSEAGQEGGITSRAGARDALKGGLKYGQYVLPEATTGGLLRKAATSAVSNTALEAGSELVDNGKVNARDLAESAVLGGVLGGAGHIADKVVGKGAKDAQRASTEVTGPIPEDRHLPAGLQTDESRLLNARNGEPARPLSEIDDELNTLQTNRDPNMSNEDAKQRFQELQDERAVAVQNAAHTDFTSSRNFARDNFENNGLPNDVPGAQKALNDFSTNPPDTVYKPSEPVQTLQDVANHPQLPDEMKQAASQIQTARNDVQTQLNSLMSPLRKQEEVNRLNERYSQELDDIKKMPPQQQEREMQSLDEDYHSAYDDLDQQEAQDADQVHELTQKLSDLHTGEQNVVLDSRKLMKENPDQFRDIDETEHQAQRQRLQDNLDQAQRFQQPERIVAEVADSPDPIRTYDESPEVQSAFVAQSNVDTQHVPDFKGLSGVRLAMLKVMSPSQILEKMGRRDIHNGLIRAESELNLANQDEAKRLGGILKNVPDQRTADQIIDYIQGKRQTLSSVDQETGDAIKSYLDEKRDILKQLGYNTLDDYFPHMFDQSDNEAVQLFKPKGSTGEVNFGNLKQRLSESDDYSRDLGKVLSIYASGLNKKLYLEPALKPLQDLKLQDGISQAEVDFINSYTNQLKGTNASEIEKSFDQVIGKGKYRQALGFQRMVSAVATMGLSPGTAIRNLTQGVNTIADIGPRYATVGTMDGTRALLAGPNSPEWKEMREMGIFGGGVSKNYFDDLNSSVNLKSKVTSTAGKTAEVMMGMIRGTDVALRAQAYYGAKALGRAKGLEGDELKNFALAKVVDTQFMTSKVDMPVGLNGPGVRSLTQLATFSGKQAGFLKRQLGASLEKGADGKYRLNEKQMGSLIAAGISAYAATEFLKPTIGFDETEWIPFYSQISPFLPGQGDSNQDPASAALYRSPIVTFLAGNGKGSTGLIQAIQSGDFKGFADDQLSSIVPAGTQIKKSYEGYTTTESGVSKNAKGSVQFLQDQGGDNQFKATLFGKYSTEAGKKWIDDKFPTLTDSQQRLGQSKEEAAKSGANINTVNRQTQQAYYNYYATKNSVKGHDKARDAVKEAAQRGDANAAQRLANEYNTKLKDSLDKRGIKYNELPDDLKQDLRGSFIDVNKIVDNLQDD